MDLVGVTEQGTPAPTDSSVPAHSQPVPRATPALVGAMAPATAARMGSSVKRRSHSALKVIPICL